jgi:hypothetical protein
MVQHIEVVMGVQRRKGEVRESLRLKSGWGRDENGDYL